MSYIEELMQKDLETLSLFELKETFERSPRKIGVSASYTEENRHALKNIGIDVELLTAVELSKAGMQGVIEDFKKRFDEGKLVSSLKENAIVGHQVLASLLENPLYVPFDHPTGDMSLYAHGQIGHTLVYYDPNIPYGFTHVFTWDGEKPVSVKVASEEHEDPTNVKRLTVTAWVAENDEFDPCVMNSTQFF
jgi:hypothetical protein